MMCLKKKSPLKLYYYYYCNGYHAASVESPLAFHLKYSNTFCVKLYIGKRARGMARSCVGSYLTKKCETDKLESDILTASIW